MQAQMIQDNDRYVPVALRPHTILGVCEAIGEDFGINPIWLRVPFAATVLLSPVMAIGGYFALAAVVLASRLMFPKPKVAPVETVIEQPTAANQQVELARAA